MTQSLGRWAGRLASIALLAVVAGAAAFRADAAAPERVAKGGARLENMRIEIWPDASSAQNSMAAVSADGSTVWVLIRRLNSSCRRSMALVRSRAHGSVTMRR